MNDRELDVAVAKALGCEAKFYMGIFECRCPKIAHGKSVDIYHPEFGVIK